MARQIAPGYCVVERPGNLDFQARELFRDIRSPAASLFMTLNADTQWLKPGQILIVADPQTTAPVTTQMLHKLRQAKQNTNNALIGVSTEDAGFLQKHYGMIAGLTSAGNQIFGTAGDVGEKYFSSVEQTLKKIEASYQNQYRTQGSLIGQQFYAERNQLLNQLKELVNKPLLKSLARHYVKFRPYEDMRRALNLSSRSIVHEWSTAGVTGIPGYSTYVGNAAKAARFLRYGGYIGIGFAFAGTTNDVADACTKGREGECGKVAFKEYGKFAISTAGGMAGGVYGGAAMMGVCTGVGIVTVGVGGVACAAVGSIAGGYIGSTGAEAIINKVIEYYDN
ncbi:hypothetical protein [Erwinia pyrifoliae]|uniref:hypothetical protein n=1 Tax=Erwinia pyrifoliae TaxID=79967 RepID=UPI0001960A79|nr:hypothetical protein [Erwinia pyrifoliae]AUX73165.1 hypothetical protein CPI84_12130 [Erwinia pyrifoliae]MCA8876553.1 hypothetical protein [Erwinia pyrifoliae]UXK11107.1 hypothetical protein NYP80_12270 [Erwinia pyrifoliae]CAX55091.1 conserved uncharacterized protein [Erwinia pyrifoliae Ep1/96]